MPSRHSRSRSRSRSRSHSPSRQVDLPHRASPISESDYFQKSDEFRVWLKTEKRKYFDELTGDKARSYFRKFVKAWNRGKLDKSLYAGIDPSTIAAPTQTGYKWSFAAKKSRTDDDAIRAARALVSAATYGPEPPVGGGGSSSRVKGPTLPSASDLVLARENANEYAEEERSYKRKRDRKEDKERIEDAVGPKEVGREGMMEAKRARREGDKAFREKGDDGFVEMDESTLLGGGDSFKERIAKRDAARRRFEQKTGKDEKDMASRERGSIIKEKESATMAMFQQMAKQRFG